MNDLYYEACSIELTRKFWIQFDEEQRVSLACGIPYFNSERLRFSQRDEGVMVTVFHKVNYEKRGWVIPMEDLLTGIDVHFQFSSEHTSEITRKIYSALKLESDFLGILKQLINFTGKGNFELGEEKFSEAVLNYWVALDTILNNAVEGNSNILKNRVSALLWYSGRSNHKSVYFKVNESYTKRSKYVHAGESASENDAIFLKSACQTILVVLVRVHTEASKNKNFTYVSWISNLDELIHAGRNSTNVPIELLQKIGIID